MSMKSHIGVLLIVATNYLVPYLVKHVHYSLIKQIMPAVKSFVTSASERSCGVLTSNVRVTDVIRSISVKFEAITILCILGEFTIIVNCTA